MGATAFAVRSCNVDALKFFMWIIQRFKQRNRGFKSRLVGSGPNSMENRKPGKQEFNSFLVGHNSTN